MISLSHTYMHAHTHTHTHTHAYTLSFIIYKWKWAHTKWTKENGDEQQREGDGMGIQITYYSTIYTTISYHSNPSTLHLSVTLINNYKSNNKIHSKMGHDHEAILKLDYCMCLFLSIPQLKLHGSPNTGWQGSKCCHSHLFYETYFLHFLVNNSKWKRVEEIKTNTSS